MNIRSMIAYSFPAKILSRLVCPKNCRPAWVRDYWAGFSKSPF